MNTEFDCRGLEANPSAIGYVSGGALQDVEGVKSLSVNGISTEAQEGAYPLSRNFYLAYCGKLNDLEQDFLTYIHSEGQEIVGEVYIPVAKSNTFLSNQAEGTIRITGSTSIAPLMEQLAQAYMEINPHAVIEVNATDSTDGLTQAMSGSCDFGMSARALKDYEMELLDYEMIAEDNIAVIVNEENPIEDISLTDLKSIYVGDIETWQELNP